MDDEYICRACNKKFKNKHGLRGHYQLTMDEEHQKLFREWGQTSEIVETEKVISEPAQPLPKIASTEESVAEEAPPIEEKPIEQPAKQEYPSIITTKEPEVWGEVPLYEERPAVPTNVSSVGTQDIRQMIKDEIQRVIPQQMNPVARSVERSVTPTDPEELEPYDWFKWFLNGKPHDYGLEKKTINMLADRVHLRHGELPQPAQFQKDLPRLQKNITPEVAATMAEAYYFDLQKYQESRRRRAEYWQEEFQGIRMPEVKPHMPYQNIRTQQIMPGQQHYQGAMIPPGSTPSVNPPMQQTLPPIQPYDPAQAYVEQQVAQQVQRYFQLQNTMSAQNPLQEEVGKLEMEIKELNRENRDRTLKELDEAKRDRDHYADMAKKHEDDKRQMEINHIRAGNQPAITSTSLEIERINKTHELDMKQQENDSEFKQTLAANIPSAITEGIRGAVDGIKEYNKGVAMRNTPGSIPGGDLWQRPCPNPDCDALITAPVGQQRVHCSKCGEWFETVPHDELNQGSFSVQQPPRSTENPPDARQQVPPKVEETAEPATENVNPPPESNPDIQADEPTNEPAPEPPPELPLRPDTGRTAATAPENKKETPKEMKKDEPDGKDSHEDDSGNRT